MNGLVSKKCDCGSIVWAETGLDADTPDTVLVTLHICNLTSPDHEVLYGDDMTYCDDLRAHCVRCGADVVGRMTTPIDRKED